MIKPGLCTALAVLSFQLSFAQTNFSGQIRSNTTWTKANSPYICSGLIEIAPDVTLTIEPGVVVQADNNINIYGAINILGSATDSVFVLHTGSGWGWMSFLSHTSQKETNNFKYCHFDHMHLTNSDGSRVNIENSVFESSCIHAQNSGPKSDMFVSNTRINNGDSFLGNTDTVIYLNNTMINGYFSAVNCNHTEYIGNNISGGKFGIECNGDGVLIKGNTITRTSTAGIQLWMADMKGDKPITDNLIYSNYNAGIKAINSTYIITRNSIYNNAVGIEYNRTMTDTTDVTIYNNCIVGNNIAFKTGAATNYHVGPNWWGTTDSLKIDTLVFDFQDDFKKGLVSFVPVLTQADSSCKAYSPPAGIQAIHQSPTVSAYPNPCDNELMLETEGMPVQEIALYNLVGVKVLSAPGTDKKYTVLNTAYLPAGIYVYKIVLDDASIATGKIVHR